jgi:hypothetical protein
MKLSFWKLFGAVLIGLPIGLYTAFVAECYWNWFAVPVLHVAHVSFLQMLGVLWLIQVITARPPSGDDKRWVLLLSAVALSVPNEKQTELKELMEPNSFDFIIQGFSAAVGQIASNTLMLVLGFALQLFV